MLQIPLSGLDVAPGQVVEWSLRATRADAVGGGGQAYRSASFNQGKHFTVAQEAREAQDHIASWIAVTFEVDEPLDQRALEAALLLFARRHEVLRCGFERLAGDLRCDVLGPDEIALDRAEQGFFDSAAELRAYLGERFEKSIDTLSWPLFLMGAVVRDESATVYLAFDHIVCDGMSMPNVVHDVRTAYDAFARGREAGLPEAGSYLDFGHEQRRRYVSIDVDDERLDHWKAFIRRNDGLFFPRFPLPLGIDPGCSYPTVNVSAQLLDVRETDALDAQCRAAGGRLFMGLLAAVGVSLRECGGPEVYRGFMPVSERGKGSWTHSMGWFVNTMPIEFPVGPGMEFAEVVAGAGGAAAEMKRFIDVPFVRAWELLAPHHFAQRSWPYAVNFFSYIDFRRRPGAENYAEWRPTMHVWALRSNGINFWFHRNTSGLHVNAIFADTPQARETAATYQRTLTGTIQRMAREGTL